MKIKNRIMIFISITLLITVIFTTNGVMATNLSENLNGTGKSAINKVISVNFTNDLKGNTGAYCIQKDKGFNTTTRYTVKNYVEINGNQATVYDSPDSEGRNVVNNLNGQVAYILNQKQGYGTHEDPTDAQNALWHITNEWTGVLFDPNIYYYDDNNTAEKNSINDDAENYANKVGTQLDSTSESGQETTNKPITDLTNKNELSVSTVDEYYRVGPFRWEFSGALESIVVEGDNHEISSSDIRFVKYSGTTPNVVNASDISTGEAFYVDIKTTAKVSKLTGLTLKTATATSSGDIYTAKIWFLTSGKTQNLIYTEVGNSKGEPSNGDGEYDVSLSMGLGLKKVDDRDTSKTLKGVGFTFSTQVLVYEREKTETGEYKETPHTEPCDCDWRDEQGELHHGGLHPNGDWLWTQYYYHWVEKTMYLGNDNTWSETPQIYYTDDSGIISIKDINYPTTLVTNEGDENGNKKDDYTVTAKLKEGAQIIATEVSNPYYGYTTGNTYTMSLNSENQLANKTLTNHQKFVKLSGYVWLDDNSGKMTVRDEVYDNDNNGKGFNGITVYLRDKSGNEIKRTTTSELNLYSEIDGGEYQFVDVDLDALQRGDYYVEFEYCGIDYQSVIQSLDKDNGSKAIDTATRNVLDNKFASVNSSGTQSLQINDVTVNYKNVSSHVSEVDNHTGCNVYARTNEAGYDLYSDFIPTSEEIRYINLGLYKKPQTDYALAQDLYNVRVEVNGFSHIYRYGTTRYTNNGQTLDEESSWNVGVKFQNNRGTYNRAIYEADAKYETENKDKELKVYVTYKIALKNQSSYLGRINNIVDYCDNRYELISAGTSIDDNDNVKGDISFGNKTEYNEEYAKYIIDVNSVVKPGETNYIYLQFKMDRSAVLNILNNNDLLNNLAEINSYTTFKDNDINKTVAVIDNDSVIGNAEPGRVNTYEDDTDAARSLKLELADARVINGTVFEDATGKDNNVYTEQERKGNGIFNENDGDKRLSGIKVTLKDKDGNDVFLYDEEQGEWNKAEVTTNENGNFEFVGYIPGNYVVTYTWGNENYKVQYYKGTIYDESRDQNNEFWYKDDVDTRKTDALDDWNTRINIDDEMEDLRYNTIENEINNAYTENGLTVIKQKTMTSSTPTMAFSVEYETTITDGTKDQVRFAINNVDFGLVERPKQQLELSKRVSGLKIVLANGQVLVDAEVTEDGQLKGTHDYTVYMGPTSQNGIQTNGTVRVEMDNEMIEGATLEITYTMEVKNIGEIDYISEKYYKYGNSQGADKVKVSVTQLLDYVDRRLSVIDDKWEEKDQNYLNDVNASQKENETYLNSTRTYITSHLSKELAPGESNTVDLHTSKLLTSTDNNTFDNQSEIVEVTKSQGENTGTPVKVTWSEDKFFFNINNAETVTIIPSTGEDRNYVIPTIIGITTLLVLGVGIFVIKKFIINNK